MKEHDSVVDWKVHKMVSEFIRKWILPVPGALIVWVKMETRSCQTKACGAWTPSNEKEWNPGFSEFSNKTPIELNREWVGGWRWWEGGDMGSPRVFSTCFEEYMMSKSSNSSWVFFEGNCCEGDEMLVLQVVDKIENRFLLPEQF